MPYLPIMGGREVFVHRLASSLARAATALAASALQAAAPDVVHAHNVGPDLMVFREAMTRSRVVPPIALTVHGLPLTMDPGRWSIARYAERVVDLVVALSEATLAELAMRAPALGKRLSR